MAIIEKPSTPITLPQFAGYGEVSGRLDVCRKTVERMVRAGTFPPPVQISPNRRGWPNDVLEGWLEDRKKKDGLKPAPPTGGKAAAEFSEADLVALVTKLINSRAGKPVDARDLGLYVTRSVTQDEFEEMERQYFAKYSERFARFDARRACVMAAWIFPGLRTIIENSVPASDRQMYSSAEMTEFFGGMALHDDNWEQLMAKYDERFGSIDE